MQLNPRYGTEPILRIEGFAGDPVALVVGQRRRFAQLLSTLDEAQWAAPSRCEGWSVQDVITHLVSTNQFWAFSIGAGLGGKPTEFLTNFDPVASPAELVAGAAPLPPAGTLAAFEETNAALAAVAESVGDRVWTTLAEAPPGHISIGALLLHGLWDGLVHERDVALPLGLTVVDDPDELAGSLAYAAALNLGFLASVGSDRTGALAVDTTDPDVHLVVELDRSVRVHHGEAPADAVRLTGSSVDVLEILSCRAPVPADIDAADRWVFEGLSTVFDQSA